MLPPLADVEALNRRIPGGIAAADEDRAAANLEDASADVRHAAGRTWVDDDGQLDDPPDIAVRITLRVAKDLFLNPHGYRSEQIGEYAWQGQTGLLTEDDVAALAKLSGDIVAVEFETPLEVNAPTSEKLAEIDARESDWVVPTSRGGDGLLDIG